MKLWKAICNLWLVKIDSLFNANSTVLGVNFHCGNWIHKTEWCLENHWGKCLRFMDDWDKATNVVWVFLESSNNCFQTVTLYPVGSNGSQEAWKCYLFVFTRFVFQEKRIHDLVHVPKSCTACVWWCSHNTPNRKLCDCVIILWLCWKLKSVFLLIVA